MIIFLGSNWILSEVWSWEPFVLLPSADSRIDITKCTVFPNDLDLSNLKKAFSLKSSSVSSVSGPNMFSAQEIRRREMKKEKWSAFGPKYIVSTLNNDRALLRHRVKYCMLLYVSTRSLIKQPIYPNETFMPTPNQDILFIYWNSCLFML